MKIQCIRCKKNLTKYEKDFYEWYQFGHGMKPTCRKCGEELIEEVRKKVAAKLSVEERMDMIQDQGQKWGGQKI